MTTRQPDAYEAETLDQITGREGSRAVVRTLTGRRYEGRIFSRVLTQGRVLDAVVLAMEDGHLTIRWAAVESLGTIPEPEESTP